MKRAITITLTAILLVLIQASPAYDLLKFSIGGKPDLLLIFVAFIACRYGSFEGVVYGFIVGLLQDVISMGMLGTYSIVFLNVGLFIGFFNNRIFSQQMTAGIFLSAISCVIKVIGLFIITAIYYDFSSVAVLIRSELFISMPLTMVLATPMFILFSKLAPLLYDRRSIYVGDNTSRYVK